MVDYCLSFTGLCNLLVPRQGMGVGTVLEERSGNLQRREEYQWDCMAMATRLI